MIIKIRTQYTKQSATSFSTIVVKFEVLKSTEKLVTRLWIKRVNLWLFRDIFHSELMHVDESRELLERVDNATLFKESCVNYINKKEMVKYWSAEEIFEKSKREGEGK